jgi:hypothetical protein
MHWKRMLVSLAALCAFAAARPAEGQVTGQYTGARVLDPGAHLFGGYLDVSSNVVGLMAQLRLSFYPGIEFGFQGGPARNDDTGSSRGTVRLGTDVRFATMQVSKGAPFDLAVGGELGTENGDNFSVLALGPTVVASRVVSGTDANGITPFIGTAILYSNIDEGSRSDTDVSFPLRLGAEFSATPTLRLLTEMQVRISDSFRDNVSFNVGVNLPF